MKLSAVQLLAFFSLIFLAGLLSGCATNEPDNASVRPWNAPQEWEGSALGGMDTQHR